MGLVLAKTILNYVQGELIIQPLHHTDKTQKDKMIGTQVTIKLAICHDYQ